MLLFKRKDGIKLSWNLTNSMKPNINSFSEDYDKKLALRNFLVRNQFGLDQIDEIMSNRDPFWEVFKYYKKPGTSGLIHDGQNIEEDTLFRNIRSTEILVIQNAKFDHVINRLFYSIVYNILYSAGYMYIAFGKSNPFSQSTYRNMLIRLSNGEVLLDDSIMTAFHITFSRSNMNMDNFLDAFTWCWDNCIDSISRNFINHIGGIDFFKGLFYKNIENSIVNHKRYNVKKIIDNNNINTSVDVDVNDIMFSSDSVGNQILFKECFDSFYTDLSNIRVFFKKANEIEYNKLFNYDIEDNVLFNSDNYFVDFNPYTKTGRKSKYPLIIRGVFDISKDINFIADVSYSQKGQVERIEINIKRNDIHRVIIAKNVNGNLVLVEIKEHDMMKEAFPIPIYKYHE